MGLRAPVSHLEICGQAARAMQRILLGRTVPCVQSALCPSAFAAPVAVSNQHYGVIASRVGKGGKVVMMLNIIVLC